MDPSVAEKRVRWTPPLLTDACMVMTLIVCLKEAWVFVLPSPYLRAPLT